MGKKLPIPWLISKLKKRIPALVLLTAARVGNALLAVSFALGTRQVINTAVSGVDEAFWHACGWQAAIIGGVLATLFLQRHLQAKLEADIDRDLKKQLLHVLLRADYPAVSAYHSGELINRLNNDVRAIGEGVLQVIPSCAAMAAQIIGAVAAIIGLQPYFAALLVGAGCLLVLFTGLARRRLKELNKRVSENDGKVSGLLQETLEKLLLVQAMDLSEEMERRAAGMLDVRYEAQRKRKNMLLVANTGVSVLYYLAGFGVLIWCAAGLLRGQMSFGDLTAMTQLVNQIQAPFVGISGVFPKYAAMIAAAERLMELDALEVTAADADMLPREAYKQMEAITAKSLTFGYDRDVILSDLSFQLEKGCFAVITGPSGRGKSTLLKLMLGIFHPKSGQLSLQTSQGEIPLTRATRRLFAYVPQGNLLFSGTIRENLLVTAPDAGEEAIRQAIHAAAMDTYLDQLPKGLDTVLGESGAGLSEGQAQRLAIARAVLGGAPVLLLDEATSALDEQTEKLVLERLRALPDRTCIAVTHRPAALEMADIRLELL